MTTDRRRFWQVETEAQKRLRREAERIASADRFQTLGQRRFEQEQARTPSLWERLQRGSAATLGAFGVPTPPRQEGELPEEPSGVVLEKLARAGQLAFRPVQAAGEVIGGITMPTTEQRGRKTFLPPGKNLRERLGKLIEEHELRPEAEQLITELPFLGVGASTSAALQGTRFARGAAMAQAERGVRRGVTRGLAAAGKPEAATRVAFGRPAAQVAGAAKKARGQAEVQRAKRLAAQETMRAHAGPIAEPITPENLAFVKKHLLKAELAGDTEASSLLDALRIQRAEAPITPSVKPRVKKQEADRLDAVLAQVEAEQEVMVLGDVPKPAIETKAAFVARRIKEEREDVAPFRLDVAGERRRLGAQYDAAARLLTPSVAQPAPGVVSAAKPGARIPPQVGKAAWETGAERPFAFDPNSTVNQGRFRLMPPVPKGDYITRQSSTSGVSYIVDTKANAIQAIRFNKAKFTEEQAAQWWETNRTRLGRPTQPSPVTAAQPGATAVERPSPLTAKPAEALVVQTRGRKLGAELGGFVGRIEDAASEAERLRISGETLPFVKADGSRTRIQIVATDIDPTRYTYGTRLRTVDGQEFVVEAEDLPELLGPLNIQYQNRLAAAESQLRMVERPGDYYDVQQAAQTRQVIDRIKAQMPIEAVPVQAEARQVGAQIPAPSAGAAGAPPSLGQPPPPAGRPPTTTGAPSPAALPSGISAAKERASATIAQDKPGTLSRLVDVLPGVKQARRFERPGLELPDQALTAWVAKTDVGAREATQAFGTRHAAFERLEKAFGRDVVRGRQRSPIAFTGTAEEGAFSGTGSLLDIAQRSHLYQLTDEQRAALAWVQQRNAKALATINQAYGTEIGSFGAPNTMLHLPNVDVDEVALVTFRGHAERAAAVGRTKTRVWETAAARQAHDPTFKPETDVVLLLSGMDEAKITAAAERTFRQLLGGKTRVEMVDELHPGLRQAKEGFRRQVGNLRQRIITAERQEKAAGRAIRGADAELARRSERLAKLEARISQLGEEYGPELSHLAGEIRVLHQEAGRVSAAALRAQAVRGIAGERRLTLLNELNLARANLDTLVRRYEAANLKGYRLVREGAWRYFPTDDALKIARLLERTNNPFLNFIESWRAGVLAGDLSPLIGVQTPLGYLFDPFGTTKQWLGGLGKVIDEKDVLRPFRAGKWAEDISRDPSWLDFASFMGRGMQAGTPQEFAGGWLRRIPGFQAVNEGMYIGVLRQSKRLWSDLTSSLMKDGVPELLAKAAAADQVGKVYPLIAPARLGQSQARAALLRATFTSISFIRKPAEMIVDAHRAYIKMALKQTLTPKEKLAARLFTSLVASVFSAGIVTSLLSAKKNNRTALEAIQDIVDPNSPRFASLVFGTRSVPIGGPYRALVKAAWPRKVEGVPVPVPFAGLATYFLSRLTPALKTQVDQLRNKDFFGNTIRYGKVPEQIIRGLAYELEEALPIAPGELARGIRTFQKPSETALETAVQFLGTNIREDTPFQQRQALVRQWARQQGLAGVKEWADLTPSQRQAFSATQPGVGQEIDKEVGRRARLGQEAFALQARAIELRRVLLAQQERDDNRLSSGAISPLQWRENRSARRTEMYNRRDEVYRGVEFPEREQTILDDYYDKVTEAKEKQNGVLNDDAWREVDAWRAQLPSAQRTFLEENTSLGARTGLERIYESDLRTLRPYFDLAVALPAILRLQPALAAQWRQYEGLPRDRQIEMAKENQALRQLENELSKLRKQMRASNPRMDAALVRWYGATPSTAEGQRVAEAMQKEHSLEKEPVGAR